MYDFFFQAEDGIRDAQESRGLGDVYKRQDWYIVHEYYLRDTANVLWANGAEAMSINGERIVLSLIHI